MGIKALPTQVSTVTGEIAVDVAPVEDKNGYTIVAFL